MTDVPQAPVRVTVVAKGTQLVSTAGEAAERSAGVSSFGGGTNGTCGALRRDMDEVDRVEQVLGRSKDEGEQTEDGTGNEDVVWLSVLGSRLKSSEPSGTERFGISGTGIVLGYVAGDKFV